MNSCNFVGNLTKDPVLDKTVNGTPVCKFTLAVKANTTKSNKADFFDFIAYNGKASVIVTHLKKGQQVGFTCYAHTNTFKDENGSFHKKVEFVVDEITFLNNLQNQDGGVDIDINEDDIFF